MKTFTLKWEQPLYQRTRDEAHRRGISMAALTRDAVTAYLDLTADDSMQRLIREALQKYIDKK
jgi:hypothetical protein